MLKIFGAGKSSTSKLYDPAICPLGVSTFAATETVFVRGELVEY